MKSISIAPNLSNGWETIRFRYVANTSKGKLPEKSEDELTAEDGVPYLSMEYLRGDAEPSDFVSARGMITAIENDILLLWDGSNAGEFLRAKTGAVSSTAALLTPTKFERGYLFWLCKGIEPVLKTFTNGMGIPHVDGEFLKNLRLPYPLDVNFQRIIASYLNRETARIDGLIAEKERMLALLEEKRAALISRVVTRGLDLNAPLKPSGQEWLGEIPVHWGLERLKFHLRRIEQGWSPQCDNSLAEVDEWGVLKVGAVNGWAFNPSENKRLPDEIEPLIEYEIRPGDVLMSRANTTQLLGSISYVQDVDSKLLLCDKLYRLEVADATLDREYLVAFMRTRPGRFQLEREASGTSGSMQNIGQDTVQNAWITIPPLDEQKKISLHINQIREKTARTEAALRNSVDLFQERRAALITAAVTGQIPPGQMQN